MSYRPLPSLTVAWGPRLETARQIAVRMRESVAWLDALDPALARLYPQFEMRAARVTDPGPVLSLSVDDLATLIDRRGRADPPPRPAPVSAAGYGFTLARVPQQGLPGAVEAAVTAGNMGSSNRFSLDAAPDMAIWRTEPLAGFIDAMIDVWDAEAVEVAWPRPLAAHDRWRLSLWRAWLRTGANPGEFLRAEDLPQVRETPHRDGRLLEWARE